MEESKKIGKGAKYLIANDLIYSITGIFLSTFLVAYFLKITNENIIQIALYYIIVNMTSGIGALLIGHFIKNKPKVKIRIFLLSIVLRAIFILFIVILGEKLASNFIIVAIFYGLSELLFWSTHETIFIGVTTNSNRQDYVSIKHIISKISKIVVPIILGSSIELYSFSKIAIYVLILSIIQIFISLQINTNEDNREEKIEKYDIKQYIKELKNSKRTKLNQYYKSNLIYGIIEDPMSTIVTILTVMTFKTSLNLGILTTIFSACAMGTIYIYKKYYNKKNCGIILWICAALIILGALGIIFNTNRLTLVIYNFACTVSLCIFDAIYNTQKGNLVQECNIEKRKVEHIMLNSFCTRMSRMTGFILILIAGIIGNMTAFKIVLLLITICVPIYINLIIKLERNEEK